MPRSQRFLSTAAHAEAEAPAPPQSTVGMESDFVVILASLLCALICVVGLLAVARCACRRRRAPAADANTNAPKAPPNRGLKKKVLESLPKLTYGKDADAGALGGEAGKFVTKECAICLGEFAEGEEIRVLPHCGHGFHVGCVDTWLGSHSSCPSCRRVLVVERCQKCGHLPAGAGAGAVANSEAQLKATATTQHNSSAYNNSNSENFLP